MNPNNFGRYALFIALLVAVYSGLASYYAAWKKDRRLLDSSLRAAFVAIGLVGIVAILLWRALFASDFSLEYVASYTDSHLPLFFKGSAFWAGQAGSLLLWTCLLCGYAFFALRSEIKHGSWDMLGYFNFVIMGILVFFLSIINFVSNPFMKLAEFRPEGNGLNPLLQHPAMVIHPPTLFMGYVGFAIPFAYAMTALLLNRTDNWWIGKVRTWTLIPWMFITAGIVLGGRWAYVELGWGGYWAWDPVENASLLPWLSGTAFLHSIMIQEKKGMMKKWNMFLIVITFWLTVFGTYLTRSGVLSSVHSFAVSDLGPYFLTFLGTVGVGAIALILYRVDGLESKNRLESYLSRETSFLLNNLVFLGLAFVTFFGTVAPTVIRVLTGNDISVRAPFFNRYCLPLGVILLALTGICPLISWRAATVRNFQRNFLVPSSVGVVSVVPLFLVGIREVVALTYFGLCFFVLATIVMELKRGSVAMGKKYDTTFFHGFWILVNKNRQRYGGYLIHAGIVAMFVGIIGSSVYQVEREVELKPGESYQVSAYTVKDFSIKFDGITESNEWRKSITKATLELSEGGRVVGKLYPQRNVYETPNGPQPITEVALHQRLSEDFYVILAGVAQDGSGLFHIYINPLIEWIWIGTFIVVIGTLFALGDKKPNRTV